MSKVGILFLNTGQWKKRAFSIGQILLGNKPGRENDSEIIYFNAVGAGIMDIALTTRCYKKALEIKEGQPLNFRE